MAKNAANGAKEMAPTKENKIGKKSARLAGGIRTKFGMVRIEQLGVIKYAY